MTAPIKPPSAVILRWGLVMILAIAFGYIEAAVVVYLRQIFHPNGFNFPLAAYFLADNSRNLLLVEVGREAATLVLLLSVCLLSGQSRPQRLAYFITIFAVWDIFYYVWLKVILDWPASIMDWDVLFLIPLPWAGPVLAPLLISLTLLVFAGIILYRDYKANPIKISLWDWLGFCTAALLVVISFFIAGRYITQPDYASYFSWLFFAAGLLAAIALFVKCLYRPNDAL